MTFLEAKEKMKEIANGRYHSLEYEFTSFNQDRVECTLYLDPGIRVSAKTWALAFIGLEEKMNPQLPEKPNLEEAPGEEAP